MYNASEWIFLDLWRFINVLIIMIIRIISIAYNNMSSVWKKSPKIISQDQFSSWTIS